jgi:uncharacterized protein YggU (UPF0235/DUF167 family)
MIISVKAHPCSKTQKISKKDNLYKVYLKSKPVDNCANAELITVLADYFQIAKSKILILRGLKSHDKILKIDI